jgi:hypothetical protein
VLEGLAMILAGVAGYADLPWWWAAIFGAIAGATNASRRFFAGPWRARLDETDAERAQALGVLLTLCLWTASGCAILFTGIWFLVRWITACLS